MWGWVLKLVSGTVLKQADKWIDRYVKFQTSREKLKVDIAKSYFDAEIKSRELAQRQLEIEHGWVVTRWIRPAFVYPLAFWWIAVIIDSIFHMGWKISRLPDPLYEWSGWIIGAYFLSRPFEKGFMAWLRS